MAANRRFNVKVNVKGYWRRIGNAAEVENDDGQVVILLTIWGIPLDWDGTAKLFEDNYEQEAG